jgi:hypothetical protein
VLVRDRGWRILPVCPCHTRRGSSATGLFCIFPFARVLCTPHATVSVNSRAHRTAAQVTFGLPRPSAGISLDMHTPIAQKREEDLR